MTKESILEAQDYLRVKTEDGYKRIIDIHALFKRHNTNEVIRFLKDYLREKTNSLKSMIVIDKTHQKVDRIVAAMFRISMAIKTLEEGEEVIILERPEQGTKESGKLHKWHSSRHNRTRRGKDSRHDGKNRKSGQTMQRAA